MEQLLRIHTVPIRIGISVERAKLNLSSRPASLDLTRERKGLAVERTDAVLHVDSAAARSSMNLKSPQELARSFAQEGARAAQAFTAGAAEERRAFLATQNKGSSPVCEFARERIRHTVQLVPAALPAVPAQISWDPPKLEMRYERDRLAFDWRVNRPQADFQPGSVEFRVEQYPKTEIEYIGKPRYVPPSADPDRGEKPGGGHRFQATA